MGPKEQKFWLILLAGTSAVMLGKLLDAVEKKREE